MRCSSGQGPPTSAATRPTTHARAGPTPHRRFHKLCRASNRAATTHISSCLPHASLNPGQNSPASICLHPKRENSPCTRKTAQIPRFWTSRGNFVTDITQGSSTGHVLSDHKLYARTLTRWLTRPPATPSMGGRHTRGQRGLAAVPVGGGGASIPKQLHLLSTPGPSRSRLCSGRRMACPPARRPRRELRSARRLEARPGPTGPAAPSTRATPAQYVVVVRPCLPCSASVYITRPRPVSRPRPRR